MRISDWSSDVCSSDLLVAWDVPHWGVRRSLPAQSCTPPPFSRGIMLELARGNLFPVLPLRDIVVFPHMIVPLFVGRDKSVRALEDVMKDDKQILLVTQKNAAQDDPTPADIYSVGTIGTVLQLLKLPDGTVKVLVEGGQRARISKYADTEDFFQAYAEAVPDDAGDDRELDALARTVVSQFEQYIKRSEEHTSELTLNSSH